MSLLENAVADSVPSHIGDAIFAKTQVAEKKNRMIKNDFIETVLLFNIILSFKFIALLSELGFLGFKKI